MGCFQGVSLSVAAALSPHVSVIPRDTVIPPYSVISPWQRHPPMAALSPHGSASPHVRVWASAQEGSVGGRLCCNWNCARTPQICLRIHHYPASMLCQERMVLDELMFSELSVTLLYFSAHLFFFLKRDFKRGSCIAAIFELSWWSLTLFFFFFYELLSSYCCFFIWTYKAEAICSVTPFKVSAKSSGMGLDHVFVCDVTVGCSGNDYNVSQRKHFVFIR